MSDNQILRVLKGHRFEREALRQEMKAMVEWYDATQQRIRELDADLKKEQRLHKEFRVKTHSLQKQNNVKLEKLKELESELEEQARLVGMSAEREAALLAENEQLKARIHELEVEDTATAEDAEQYRYLKEHVGCDSPTELDTRDIVMYYKTSEWDELINAAREQGDG